MSAHHCSRSPTPSSNQGVPLPAREKCELQAIRQRRSSLSRRSAAGRARFVRTAFEDEIVLRLDLRFGEAHEM